MYFLYTYSIDEHPSDLQSKHRGIALLLLPLSSQIPAEQLSASSQAS